MLLDGVGLSSAIPFSQLIDIRNDKDKAIIFQFLSTISL